MLYLKVTLQNRGKVVGPFPDEEEVMEAESKIKEDAAKIICHNNRSLLENGLHIEEITHEEELVTVSKIELFSYLTDLPLDIAA